MFEIVLTQDYEDEFNFRKLETQMKEQKEYEQYDQRSIESLVPLLSW